jgi:hypothetical protein
MVALFLCARFLTKARDVCVRLLWLSARGLVGREDLAHPTTGTGSFPLGWSMHRRSFAICHRSAFLLGNVTFVTCSC